MGWFDIGVDFVRNVDCWLCDPGGRGLMGDGVFG